MSLNQSQSGKHGFPIRLLTAAFVISILATAFTGWLLWQELIHIEKISKKHIVLTESVGRIMLLDELLTMSARLTATTGDFSYGKRYDQFEPQLSAAINDLRAMLTQQEIKLILVLGPRSFILECFTFNFLLFTRGAGALRLLI